MSTPARRHPLFWVPSLYLAMGLPNVTVSVVAAIMYKNMGISNSDIALYTSQMYLPWALKPLWSPFMEPYRTKKFWVVSMQFALAALIGLVAFSLPLPSYFKLSLAFFWIAGFASSTQDIAADAVYMSSLTQADQARYTGLCGMCWNMGSVLASGVLVWVTGALHEGLGLDWTKSWVVVMGTIAALMALFGIWHLRHLPVGDSSPLAGKGPAAALQSLRETWATFFQKKSIWLMLGVVFFYRFGEGFIEKFGPLFLLDSRGVGGLGLNNQQLGNIYGSIGTIAFIVGALLGGFIAAKMTLKRSFFVLALALNVPHITFFLLSQFAPQHLGLITTLVAIEKFGYGLGSVGHMLYMMQQIAPGPFRMTHYAFATGIMALNRWATGTLSGWVYDLLGGNYNSFFIFVLVASIPPLVFAWIAPFPIKTEEARSE